MRFDDTQIKSIIETYKNNKALLGPYPIPTFEAVKAMDIMLGIVRSCCILTMGGGSDEEGYIAITVLHSFNSSNQNLFSFGFSGGQRSRENFDAIKNFIGRNPSKDGLKLLVDGLKPMVKDPFFAFQYDKVPLDPRSCGEPKALYNLIGGGGELRGYACCWCSDNQLTTPHRLNIGFVPSNEAFMTPCNECIKNFELVNQGKLTVKK